MKIKLIVDLKKQNQTPTRAALECSDNLGGDVFEKIKLSVYCPSIKIAFLLEA